MSTRIVTLVILAALATAAVGETQTPGALRAVGEDGRIVEMPLRQTRVSVEISAFVARTQVEQVFVNPFAEPVEAVYFFPLGERAAVDDFEMQIGPRLIRGEIHRRAEAQRIYEEARTSGFQAALLEQQRPNVFRQAVANLMPGEEIRVRIRTVETLRYEAGEYEFIFPLVVGPRYMPGELLHDGAGVASPETCEVDPLRLPPGTRSGHDVELRVALNAGVPIGALQTPNHRVLTRWFSPSEATLELEGGPAIPNRDFMLRWSVASADPAVGLLTHRTGVDGYFALLVQPRAEADVEAAMPKEILLVFDCSGSMDGVPLELAKAFATRAIETLGSRDRLNLVEFSDTASILSGESLDSSEESRRLARTWVRALSADGGTRLARGLAKALSHRPDPDRYRMIVFLTDGYIGNEDEILDRISRIGGETRIFTVGLGTAVNHYLLQRMAEIGRGAYTVIPTNRQPREAVARFHGWVTRPYLTDLEVDWGALPVLDTTPRRLPDLFSGQNLAVVGRYAGAGEGPVTVRGRLGGRYWEQRFEVSLPEAVETHAALASIWARRRIGELLPAGPDFAEEEAREEVTRLALEHRLMSPFTSFVAVDTTRVANPDGRWTPVEQAVPLPRDVTLLALNARGQIHERVAAAVVVDLHATAASTRFSDQFIHDLPVPGRFYQNVLTLAPGVQDGDGHGNPYVHASRARDLQAVVSGVGNVDPLSGGFHGHVSPNSVEEMEVISAGAGVEFGRSQGGFARIVQSQGSNEHEGSVELILRSDELDRIGSGAPRGVDPPAYRGTRPAFQVSGPIVRDRLFYRLAHEWNFDQAPLDTIDVVEAVTMRSATHADQLTWQASPRNKLSFRTLLGDSTAGNRRLGSRVPLESTVDVERDDRIYSLAWTVPYSARTIFETTLTRGVSRLESRPAFPGAANDCAGPAGGPWSGAYCLDLATQRAAGPAWDRAAERSERLLMDSRATFYGGHLWGARHQLKLGFSIETERVRSDPERGPLLARGPLEDGGGEQALLGRVYLAPDSDPGFDGSRLALFAEDTIKPVHRLAMTLGLRLDRESITYDGFEPFDPRAELERFLARGEGLTDAERRSLAAETFTGYEGTDLLARRLAGQLGLGQDPGLPAAPFAGLPRRAESVHRVVTDLSPFLGISWDPWNNGKSKLALTGRRYHGDLFPLAPLFELEPVAVDLELGHGDTGLAFAGTAYPAISIRQADRGLRTPYHDEWTLVFEREIAAETLLRLSRVRRRYEDQLVVLDLNHRTGGDADPDGSTVLNPLWGEVLRLVNEGRADYRAWTLELRRRHYRSWECQAAYTFSRLTGTGGPAPGRFEPESVAGDGVERYLEDDRRHQVQLRATVLTPGAFRIGGSVSWQSGLPFALLDQQLRLDHLPAIGAEAEDRLRWPRPVWAGTGDDQRRNASYWSVDLKVAREIVLGRGIDAEVSLEAFNLLDDRTYLVYDPQVGAGRRINGVDDARRRFGRRLQLGMRLVF